MARTRMRWLRPFTTHVFNRFSRLFAGYLPGFAILRYQGRRSGKRYRTPMNVFRRDGDYVFALTYGSDVQWVRNVQAAGGCEMQTLGRVVRLTDPRLIVDPTRRLVPFFVRPILALLRVTEFLLIRPVASA